MGHFNVSLTVWAKSQDSVHKPQFLKRKESRSGSNRGPSAYQSSALPLGHTGSLTCCEAKSLFYRRRVSSGTPRREQSLTKCRFTPGIRGKVQALSTPTPTPTSLPKPMVWNSCLPVTEPLPVPVVGNHLLVSIISLLLPMVGNNCFQCPASLPVPMVEKSCSLRTALLPVAMIETAAPYVPLYF